MTERSEVIIRRSPSGHGGAEPGGRRGEVRAEPGGRRGEVRAERSEVSS